MKRIKKFWRGVADVRRFFSIGFLCGFMGAGPALLLILIFLNAYPSIVTIPIPSLNGLSVSQYNPFLISRVLSANRDGRTIVIGSSEFEATPDGPPLRDLMIEATMDGKKKGPVVTAVQGSAVTRTLFLLERLHLHGVSPKRLLVVINPFYATAANDPHPADLRSFYPDAETMLLDYTNSESLFAEAPELREGLFGPVNTPRHNRLQLHTMSVRNMIRDGIGIPLRERMNIRSERRGETVTRYRKIDIDPEWGIDTELVFNILKYNKIYELKKRRPVSTDLIHTHFGRTLLLLRRATLHLPEQIGVTILLLPVNRPFYRKLGLNPIRSEDLMRQTIKQAFAGTDIRICNAEELAAPGMFYDSIHFTTAGRQILTRIILDITP
jgi:hypothetical protein